MADSAGEFPWLYEENLTSSFYQRKYPTRLPKLPGTHPKTVELDETETNTKKRNKAKISIESKSGCAVFCACFCNILIEF